jgi:hypothetical protein
MEDSHPHLLITGDEWDAFIDDLNQTLDKFEVPQQERSEVLAIIESTRDAIVDRPSQLDDGWQRRRQPQQVPPSSNSLRFEFLGAD